MPPQRTLSFERLERTFRDYCDAFPEQAFPTFLEALLFEPIGAAPVPPAAPSGRPAVRGRGRRRASRARV